MVALKSFAFAASLIGFVAAQGQGLSITYPSAQAWWVADSANTLTWTCTTSPFPTFTVLMANTNTSILVAPQAFISIQQNADCSKLLTQQQTNYAAAPGYTILLANPLNETDVYAQTEPFEIRPLGSAYPVTSSAAAPGVGSATGAGSAPGASTTAGHSGAVSLETLGLGLSAGIAAGIAYLM